MSERRKAGWVERLASWFGMVPAGQVQATLRSGMRRAFEAAKASRLVSGWGRSNTVIDRELRLDLVALRERSRDLVKNTSFGARAVHLVKSNVVGADGIRLRMNVQEVVNGQTISDDKANLMIQEGWEEWCKPQNCTVHGKYTFKEVQDLVAQGVFEDGEHILRHRFGVNNGFGYALQIIEVSLLDETWNREKGPDWNKISMGVELDDSDKPVAYWFRQRNLYTDTYYERERVPAEEIMHIFNPMRAGQTRGYPAAAAVLKDTKMLDGYYEAEITAARLGAAKAGFFKTPTGGEFEGEEDTETGGRTMEVEPGVFEEMPAGWDFVPYNPEHPNAAFPTFVKTFQRSIASGYNLAYHSLANDLEGVNYSSIRAGELQNRETFKQMQRLLKDHANTPIFEKWLMASMMSGAVKLPLGKFEKFNSPVWHARTWDWVDPLKDMQATILELQAGLTTHAAVLGESGKDLNEVWNQLSKEKELAKKMGLMLTAFTPKPTGTPAASAGDGNEEDQGNGKGKDVSNA